MGFLDKAKAAAEQAATKAKEGVEDVQARRELSQATGELGKAAFELIESGEITHPQLAPLADKVRAANERVEGGGGGSADPEPAGAAAEPHDAGLPPAMPN